MNSERISLVQYLVRYLKEHKAEQIFAISGASNLRILDAIAQDPQHKYICPHHEQAGVMAAMSYHRISGKAPLMLVTAGPGGTNTVTGVASAYLDSIPMIVIAGQERAEFLSPRLPLRGKGVQGLPMVELIRPVTKYAVSLNDPHQIAYELDRCFYEAFSGRPGPVWLEIPQDLQTALVDPAALSRFSPPASMSLRNALPKAEEFLKLLQNSERPVIWAGHGIRLSGQVERFRRILEKLQVPVLTAWNGADLLESDHPLYAGRAGIYGNRASNFIVQNCDLVAGLGTRFAIPQIGYVQEEFARAAKKVVVEIDLLEIQKWKIPLDLVFEGNVGDFLVAVEQVLDSQKPQLPSFSNWINRCHDYKQKFPLVTQEQRDAIAGRVNSYHFIETLSDTLPSDWVIVTDMGTSLTCTHATWKIKKGQRLVTSTGLGEMGFGLPGAIGACFGNGKQKTVFIGVEGSLQMNLQEFQTVVHYKLPLKTFILNNNGYLTIQHTERALFGNRFSGCSPETGVSFPELSKIAAAYGIRYVKINSAVGMKEKILSVLEDNEAVICDVLMPEDQFLGPKTSVKVRKDGSLFSPPLEDLFPFLDRKEFHDQMIIPPLPDNEENS